MEVTQMRRARSEELLEQALVESDDVPEELRRRLVEASAEQRADERLVLLRRAFEEVADA